MSYNSFLAKEYAKRLKETECTFPKYAARKWSWERVLKHDEDYGRWVVNWVENIDEELRDAIEWWIAEYCGSGR